MARALEVTRQDQVSSALESFGFVGVTDELQRSADLFADTFGLRRAVVPRERVAVRDDQMTSLSAIERSKIEQLYPLECELYARARDNVDALRSPPRSPANQFDYLRQQRSLRAEAWAQSPTIGAAAILSVRAHDQNGESRARFDCRERVGVTVTFEVRDASAVVEPAIRLTRLGHVVFVVAYSPDTDAPLAFGAGQHEVTTWIPGNLLNTGPFGILASLAQPSPVRRHDQLADALTIEIFEPEDGTDTARGAWRTEFPGGVRPLLKWTSAG